MIKGGELLHRGALVTVLFLVLGCGAGTPGPCDRPELVILDGPSWAALEEPETNLVCLTDEGWLYLAVLTRRAVVVNRSVDLGNSWVPIGQEAVRGVFGSHGLLALACGEGQGALVAVITDASTVSVASLDEDATPSLAWEFDVPSAAPPQAVAASFQSEQDWFVAWSSADGTNVGYPCEAGTCVTTLGGAAGPLAAAWSAGREVVVAADGTGAIVLYEGWRTGVADARVLGAFQGTVTSLSAGWTDDGAVRVLWTDSFEGEATTTWVSADTESEESRVGVPVHSESALTSTSEVDALCTLGGPHLRCGQVGEDGFVQFGEARVTEGAHGVSAAASGDRDVFFVASLEPLNGIPSPILRVARGWIAGEVCAR